MKLYSIVHYRYKASEVAHLYKLAQDYGISADKLIKDRNKVACYKVQSIPPEDIFPRGGLTVLSYDDGESYEAECSFQDNYNRRQGVRMCFGRRGKIKQDPF